MKPLNIKKFISLIFILIILNIYMYNINKYYDEKIFIKYCIEYCLNDIYYYMIQENSKIYFGHYEICFGTEKISLLSNFYNDYIINKKYIITYLESINWYEVILDNQKDLKVIAENIRESYIRYLEKEENDYTLELVQNSNMENIKVIVVNLLQNYINNIELNPLKKTIVMSNTFITNIINNVEWNCYIRTLEFQHKEFSTLIEFSQNKVENINILQDISTLTFKELVTCKYFIFNVLFILAGVSITFPILFQFLCQGLPYIILTTFFSKKTISIVLVVLHNTPGVEFQMTSEQFFDLVFILSKILLENENAWKLLLMNLDNIP